MKYFFFIIIILNLLFPQGWYNHPELDWKTIETEHFLIHYHLETYRSAQEAAAVSEKIYEPIEPNIPYDIQILINKDEMGLALLRIVEIIGEDNLEDLDPETLFFITTTLNKLSLKKIRNNIIIKTLPSRV